MPNILVTGGAGFIGSHTCLALLEKGFNIEVIDSFINSNPISIERILEISDLKKSHNRINVVQSDLRNIEKLNEIFINAKEKGNPIQGVIHFAGLKSVYESVKNPLLYWDNNLIGSINLLKIMDKNDCRTLVFSSSATVYGFSGKSFIKESEKLEPVNPYGNTKFVIEKLLHDIYNSSQCNWSIANLRYFNPIGAHKSGLIGENPLGAPNNIFPIILQVAARKIPELKIYGKDWPTKDGTGVRDYIHVMDLADGHVLAMEHILQNSGNILDINLGTGIGTSVLELVNIFKKINKIEVPYSFSKRRNGDVSRLVADNTFCRSILNWNPIRSIEDMCRDGWHWKELNPDGL